MKPRQLQLPLIIIIFAMLSLPTVAFSGLSDEEKKAEIYSMYAEYKKEFPRVVDISPKEAMRRISAGEKVVFIDVRSPEEIEVSALPHSITKDEFLRSHNSYDSYTVIGYCTISYRSGIFAQQRALNGETIYNLTGGLLAWTHENGPIYSKEQQTKQIHVYAERWNYPPQGYEPITFPFWKQILQAF